MKTVIDFGKSIIVAIVMIVIPAVGKTVGDEVNYGGLLGSAPVMNINTNSPLKFISRGGRIPAPIHSQRN